MDTFLIFGLIVFVCLSYLLYLTNIKQINKQYMFIYEHKSYKRWMLLEKELYDYEYVADSINSSIYQHPDHPNEILVLWFDEGVVSLHYNETNKHECILSNFWETKSKQIYDDMIKNKISND